MSLALWKIFPFLLLNIYMKKKLIQEFKQVQYFCFSSEK